jgi:hypothetical protein
LLLLYLLKRIQMLCRDVCIDCYYLLVLGITLRSIKPGRFTETTGYWNQRYLGHLWNHELRPPV